MINDQVSPNLCVMCTIILAIVDKHLVYKKSKLWYMMSFLISILSEYATRIDS